MFNYWESPFSSASSYSTYPAFSARALPSPEALARASKLTVMDSQRRTVTFGLLFEKKVVIVFIRHFFCGSCLSYVDNLTKVSQEALTAAGMEIVVIGCGEPECIPEYVQASGFHGPIYADPTRELFRAMGMTLENLKLNPSKERRAAYLKGQNIFQIVLSGVKRAWRVPGQIGKQGNIFQLGGEFVLGPGLQCSYASRMEHTMHHSPVEDVMRAAGVEYTEEDRLTCELVCPTCYE
ncbi:AhpC/TSA antioxidant enzyme-domain-containing protein [Coprinopsis sp. MPI-PUGE-AT-0042]|nr:AhpC/TSA antioxidant enzyme-domain-containing protein [Coprinopsis sp. MPI-PUGE-AT-0042]